MTRSLRAAAWGCVLVVAILSLLPAQEMVRTNLGGYVEHALAYAGTALLMRLGYPALRAGPAVLALVLYAGGLEILQQFSHGRTSSVASWLASSAGVVLGSWAADRMGSSIRRLLLRVAGQR